MYESNRFLILSFKFQNQRRPRISCDIALESYPHSKPDRVAIWLAYAFDGFFFSAKGLRNFIHDSWEHNENEY